MIVQQIQEKNGLLSYLESYHSEWIFMEVVMRKWYAEAINLSKDSNNKTSGLDQEDTTSLYGFFKIDLNFNFWC